MAKIDGDPQKILQALLDAGTEENRAGMARFGIRPAKPIGVSVTYLRSVARQFRRNHELAADLWSTGIHEARILASMLDEPGSVTQRQMDAWVRDFDSWDICDQTCGNLFDKTPYVIDKAHEWAIRQPEYERRAGFVLMAAAAVHDRHAPDSQFVEFLPVLETGMTDERNFVKKAVSWSFRQIGKRNLALRDAVLHVVEPMRDDNDRTTRWIARDVTKELHDPKIVARVSYKRAVS